MKKTISILAMICVLFIALGGCSQQDTVVKKGNFSFDLIEGFVLADVNDENCKIVRDETDEAVGGVEITSLRTNDLSDDTTTNIMLYLQNEFHETNDVEFFASRWGEEKGIVIINLTKGNSEEEKESFYHVFFEQDSSVYHMWLDLSGVDQEIAEEFVSAVAVDGN